MAELRRITRDIVGGVLVSQDNKVFLGQHRAGGVYQECWIIPGGGIEEGESQEDALHREMLEETGIDTTGCPIEFLNTDTGSAEKILKTTGERVIVDMTFYDFRITLPLTAEKIPPSPDDELVRSHWYSIEELKGLRLSPPTEKLFRKIGYLP